MPLASSRGPSPRRRSSEAPPCRLGRRPQRAAIRPRSALPKGGLVVGRGLGAAAQGARSGGRASGAAG
eukprot:5541022-Alexandrium_andersonii.AAC.1